MQPGNARAKECLEDAREKEGFSKPCREELEKMMAARAADFRLDPKLRQLCARDIQVPPAVETVVNPVKKKLFKCSFRNT